MSLVLYGTSGDVRAELQNASEAEYSASDIERGRIKATNLVNSYVAKAYPDSIPFASNEACPQLLQTITDDLAVYYCKRSKHPGPGPLSEDVKKEYYQDSIDLLEKIGKGDLELNELKGSAGDNISAPQSGYTPVFNIDSDLDSVVDPDQLKDVADDRS